MHSNSWTWTLEDSFPSQLGAHEPFLKQVLEKLEEHNWEHKDIFGVHLSLEEALVNAIRHGNCQDQTKQVLAICNFCPDKLRVEITDEGSGFCPDEVPDPTEDENLDVPSGRGIMLMRSYMNRVEYNSRGNQVVMEKSRLRES